MENVPIYTLSVRDGVRDDARDVLLAGGALEVEPFLKGLAQVEVLSGRDELGIPPSRGSLPPEGGLSLAQEGRNPFLKIFGHPAHGNQLRLVLHLGFKALKGAEVEEPLCPSEGQHRTFGHLGG